MFRSIRNCSCGAPIRGPSRNKSGKCRNCVNKYMQERYKQKHKKE